MLERRIATAPGTRVVLAGLFDRCAEHGIIGIPPGLAISAVLGEMYMQDFDASMRRELNAHFYARYVDDIILVLPPINDLKSLRRSVIQMLPKGLELNEKKTHLLNFSKEAKQSPSLEHQFDYLGFSFEVSEIGKKRPYKRTVRVDIAASKVKNRKTRIVCSFLQFLKDKQFDDLCSRLRIISCNYKFYDSKKSRIRSAGIYHTYGLIDQSSSALCELDSFKSKILLSKTGKLSEPLSLLLSSNQKKELLSLTFVSAFSNKIHFHFTPDRLKYLMECWKYA